MNQLPTSQVFISYSRRDDVVTRRIVAFLRKQGLKVWVDNEKLTPGTPIWEAEIEKAIKAASAIVVMLSPDSKDSEWVRREITLADHYRKRVFPVLVRGDEETSISLRLLNRQFVDIRENEDAGLGSLEIALLGYLQELSVKEEEKTKIDAQKLAEEKARQLSSQKLPEEPKSEKKEDRRGSMVKKKASAEKITSRERPDDTNTLPLDYAGIFRVTLGWAIGGLIGGFIYSEYGEIAGGAVGGTIGGLVAHIVLKTENVLSQKINITRFTLAWAIGGAIGWLIGWELTEAIGAGIGMAIFAMIGMVSTVRRDYIRSNWIHITWITLAWAISGAVGWSIAKGMIEGPSIDTAISWAIGTAIGWAIGGFVMGWQLTRR